MILRMKIPVLSLACAALTLFSVSAQTDSTAAALPPLPPDGFVTLQQIVGEFSSNPTAALQKYNGMRILVYGRVGQVTQSDDSDGDPLTVFLQLPNQTTPDVKAVFGADDVPTTDLNVAPNESKAVVFHRNRDGDLTSERSFIVVGENIGVRGTFDNFVAGDIVLKNSFKVRPADLQKTLSENGVE